MSWSSWSSCLSWLSWSQRLSPRAGRCWAGGRAGRGSALRLAVRRNPAWTARIPRAPSLGLPPRARRPGRAQQAPGRTGTFRPPSRRTRLRSEPLPTLPRQRYFRWVTTFAGCGRGFAGDRSPGRPFIRQHARPGTRTPVRNSRATWSRRFWRRHVRLANQHEDEVATYLMAHRGA